MLYIEATITRIDEPRPTSLDYSAVLIPRTPPSTIEGDRVSDSLGSAILDLVPETLVPKADSADRDTEYYSSF